MQTTQNPRFHLHLNYMQTSTITSPEGQHVHTSSCLLTPQYLSVFTFKSAKKTNTSLTMRALLRTQTSFTFKVSRIFTSLSSHQTFSQFSAFPILIFPLHFKVFYCHSTMHEHVTSELLYSWSYKGTFQNPVKTSYQSLESQVTILSQ